MEHDKLCPEYGHGWTRVFQLPCQCMLIDSVRRDEHKTRTVEGWISPEAHEAIVATARVRVALHEQEEIAKFLDEHGLDNAAWFVRRQYKGGGYA